MLNMFIRHDSSYEMDIYVLVLDVVMLFVIKDNSFKIFLISYGHNKYDKKIDVLCNFI